MKSPFQNCRVIGHGISARQYLAPAIREDGTSPKRGDADYVMSRGELMDFAVCPSRWLAGYREDGKDSTDWGTLIDTAFLSDDFSKLYSVAPETYTAEPKKKGDEPQQKPWNNNATVCWEWNAEQGRAGRSVIKIHESEAADTAIEKLWADPQVKALMTNAKTQVMVVGTYVDPETAIVVPLKGMLDIVPDVSSSFFGKCLADFKTARSASQREWTKAVFNHHYDAQAALYLDLYVAATGEDRVQFLHLIQESFPPYEIGRRIISEQFVEVGRNKYLSALCRYCECLATGIWPGYDADGINGWSIVDPESYMVSAT
jgi:hypothetical protein